MIQVNSSFLLSFLVIPLEALDGYREDSCSMIKSGLRAVLNENDNFEVP